MSEINRSDSAERAARPSAPPEEASSAGLEAGWQSDPGRIAVFAAALSGICANPAFFGPLMQQSPTAALDFAEAALAEFARRQNAERALAEGRPQ